MIAPPEAEKSPFSVEAEKGAKGEESGDSLAGQNLLQIVGEVNAAVPTFRFNHEAPPARFPTPSGGGKSGGADASGPFSIGSISPHFFVNSLGTNNLQDGDFRLFLYPSGVILRQEGLSKNEAPECGPRGDIFTFSDKSARRLREFTITHFVPEAECFATTLTTHRAFTPAEWRAATKRFAIRLKRKGWAGIWRVELQRRQAPHLHVALYIPRDQLQGVAGEARRMISVEWLKSTGEHRDADAQKFAVMCKQIDGAGWTVYMSLHDSKSKKAQLGWEGRQWGVWHAGVFREIACEGEALTHFELVQMRRFLNRWNRAKLRDRVARFRSALRFSTDEEKDELRGKIKSARASKRFVGNGGFLRVMDCAMVHEFLTKMRGSNTGGKKA